MASYIELILDQGSTFNYKLNLVYDANNNPMNLSSYTAQSQLRKSYYTANASGNLTCSITGTSNGEITLSMTSANTANLEPVKHLFDVELILGSTVTRIVEGTILVTPEVTKL